MIDIIYMLVSSIPIVFLNIIKIKTELKIKTISLIGPILLIFIHTSIYYSIFIISVVIVHLNNRSLVTNPIELFIQWINIISIGCIISLINENNIYVLIVLLECFNLSVYLNLFCDINNKISIINTIRYFLFSCMSTLILVLFVCFNNNFLYLLWFCSRLGFIPFNLPFVNLYSITRINNIIHIVGIVNYIIISYVNINIKSYIPWIIVMNYLYLSYLQLSFKKIPYFNTYLALNSIASSCSIYLLSSSTKVYDYAYFYLIFYIVSLLLICLLSNSLRIYPNFYIISIYIIALFSLASIPPTNNFIIKYLTISAIVSYFGILLGTFYLLIFAIPLFIILSFVSYYLSKTPIYSTFKISNYIWIYVKILLCILILPVIVLLLF